MPKEESVGVFAQMRFLVIFWMVLSITPSTHELQKNVTNTQYKSTCESNISGRKDFFLRKHPHTQHQDEPTPAAAQPPAALPSFSMATSAMDPMHGTAPPHESCAGARGRGFLATLPPLDLGAKRHPSKNREVGGASTLDGCQLTG